MGEPPEWRPILLGALFKRFGRDSWANGPDRAEGMAEVERARRAYGLPTLRWPEPVPPNTLVAMRAATFAKEIGRTVSFSLAAFRQAFAAGRDLGDPDNVVLAAAAAELHPRALLAAVDRDSGQAGAARGDRPRRRPRRPRRPEPSSWAARSSGATTASPTPWRRPPGCATAEGLSTIGAAVADRARWRPPLGYLGQR